MESNNQSNNHIKFLANDDTHMSSSPEVGSPPQVPLHPSSGEIKVVADPNGTYEGEEESKEEQTTLAMFEKHTFTLPTQSLSFLFVSAWGIPLTRAEWILILQMVHALVSRLLLPCRM